MFGSDLRGKHDPGSEFKASRRMGQLGELVEERKGMQSGPKNGSRNA